MKSRSIKIMAAAAAILATFAVVGCSEKKIVERVNTYVYVSESCADNATSTTDVVKAVADSVVEIRTEYVTTQWGMQYVVSGAGSGVIVSHAENTDSYYIVTNHHVIDGAKNIEVTLRNGSEHKAQLVATDERCDIAVIGISSDKALSVAVWGDSDALLVGEDVIAIGNPLGSLGGTVTKGIISATERNIVINNYSMTLLQTDTAINPGNSGGGLFDMNGNLVGIVNAKKSDEEIEGICFAIPSNTARRVYGDLLTYGAVQGRVTFGITVAESNGTVYVSKVNDGTDGFRQYDKISKINGKEITSVLEFNNALEALRPGDSVKVVVYHGTRQDSMFGSSIKFDSNSTTLSFTARQA